MSMQRSEQTISLIVAAVHNGCWWRGNWWRLGPPAVPSDSAWSRDS